MARDVAKIVENTDDFLNRNIDGHQLRLQKSIEDLEKRVINQVNSLQTNAAGNLLGPKVNLKQAQKVHKQLTGIFDSTYGAGVRDVVAGYDDAAEHVLTSYRGLGVAANFTGQDKALIDTLKGIDFDNFMNLGQSVNEEIVQAMYNAVAGGASFDSLLTAVKGKLTGSVDAAGRSMVIHAKTLTNDALMNFHNQVNLNQANAAGLKHFLYVGNVIGTTRDFCAKRAGKVYSKKVIDSWNFNWQGKSGPAFTHRGGYNCRHHWQGVDPDWVEGGSIDVQRWEDLDIEERYDILRGALSPSEKLFKKRLNQFRYHLKVNKFGADGAGFNVDGNMAKMWYNIPAAERAKLIASWEKSKINVPDVIKQNLTKPLPPADFVEIPKSVVPDKPPIKPPPAPVEPPTKVKPPPIETNPEEIIVAPPDQPAPSNAGGYNWGELDEKQKKLMNNLQWYVKSGKKLDPDGAMVYTWDTLSYETQQMKLKQWTSKGFTIPPELVIKGDSLTEINIIQQAADIADQPSPKPWAYKSLDDAVEQVKKEFKFKDGVDFDGFDTDADKLLLLNDYGAHMNNVLQSNPKLQSIVNDWGHGTKLSFANRSTLGGGTLGVYSDTEFTLKLAAKRAMKNNAAFGKNAFTVGDDFFTVSRHEFGHYVDETIRTYQGPWQQGGTKGLGFNHQTEWRKVFQSYSKEDWAKMFGKYSSDNKYEGFAEVFALYTSSEYKAGTMPYKIEEYMHRLLGGPLAEANPSTVVKPIKKPKVTKSAIPAKLQTAFKNPEHQEMFNQMFTEYREKKLTVAEIKNEIRARCPNVRTALNDWQGSTQTPRASALKLKAELLENRNDIKFFARKGNTLQMSKIQRIANEMPDEEYLRIRAIVQEYYDRKKTKTVPLYRGTDGRNSGPEFRRRINDAKASIPEENWNTAEVQIEEPSLTGWSSSEAIADRFGVRSGGVTASVDIPTEEIFIPDTLWPKVSYSTEKEFVVFSKFEAKYKLSEFRSGYKPTIAKAANAEALAQTSLTFSKAVEYQIPDFSLVIESELQMKEAISTYVAKQAVATVNQTGKLSSGNWKALLSKKIKGVKDAIANDETVKIFNSSIGSDKKEKFLELLEEAYKTVDLSGDKTGGEMKLLNIIMESLT